MEPADRTWYTEGRVPSISKRLFASHGLEKYVSQALEEMCLERPELFHITSFIFTVFVVFLATSHLFLTATRVWAWAAVKLPNFIFVVKLFSTTPVPKKKVCLYMKRRERCIHEDICSRMLVGVIKSIEIQSFPCFACPPVTIVRTISDNAHLYTI